MKETATKARNRDGTTDRQEDTKSHLWLLQTDGGPGPSFGVLGHSCEAEQQND